MKRKRNSIPFNLDFECEYGVMVQLSPLVRRIVANNPGPYTYKGTGTYIVGTGKVAVIDPGPYDRNHVDAMLYALKGEEITHQFITHTHKDHSPAAELVKALTGAKTYGFGPHGSGKYSQGFTVEAGGDMEFIPDITIKDGQLINGGDWTFESIHTPGHTSNHVCFHLVEENVLFPGDHVMGWSTTVVSPPGYGTGSAGLFKTIRFQQGDTVIGFFMDGDNAQIPMILGAMGNSESNIYRFNIKSRYISIFYFCPP